MERPPVIGSRVRVKDANDRVVVDAGRVFANSTKVFCGSTFVVESVSDNGWISLKFDGNDNPENYKGRDIQDHQFKSAWLELLLREGDFVKFIDEDAHERSPYIFPIVGAVGEVLRVCPDGDLVVRWPVESLDTSTSIYGMGFERYCNPKRVEYVSQLCYKDSEELNAFFDEL